MGAGNTLAARRTNARRVSLIQSSTLAKMLSFSLSSCGMAKALSSTFYLPSRMGATYPRLSLTDKVPQFKNLEGWQSRKSTKVDICALMCLHLLSRDDAPNMIFLNGTVDFPEVPKPMHGEQVSQKRKILIYEEFPTFGPLVRSVCILLTTSGNWYSTCTGFQLLQHLPLVHGWVGIL